VDALVADGGSIVPSRARQPTDDYIIIELNTLSKRSSILVIGVATSTLMSQAGSVVHQPQRKEWSILYRLHPGIRSNFTWAATM
jgi:hypothetical protein